MHQALSRLNLISLAAGFTDSESLPVESVRECFEEVLRAPEAARAALQYGSSQGEPVLRELTARHLFQLDFKAKQTAAPSHTQRRRVLRDGYSPDRMIITNGSQQLLYMVTEALCDEGDIVLVEDPTYFVFLEILKSRGIRARGVRMERDGLDLKQLENVLKSLNLNGELRRVKAIYLVSYFQNPTGTTTTFRKKEAALQLLRQFEKAAGHSIYLLEDAAYRELRFAGDDVPSALGLRQHSERVVYAGTYSKPFATGTRVGYGLLPEPLFTAVLRIKGNHDFGTSNLLQQLLAAALKSGRYEKHLVKLRKRYAHKARIMRDAFRKYLPAEVNWAEPQGGLYFWTQLPERVRTDTHSKLFKTALARNVLYVPGELCYADDSTRLKPNYQMRISFGSASEREICEGIRRLGAVVRKFVS